MRKPESAYAKTKAQISFAVTAKLISAFVFATWIVHGPFLFFLNPKFQASSHPLWLHRPICVGAGRKPRRPVFSCRGSYIIDNLTNGMNMFSFIISHIFSISSVNKLRNSHVEFLYPQLRKM